MAELHVSANVCWLERQIWGALVGTYIMTNSLLFFPISIFFPIAFKYWKITYFSKHLHSKNCFRDNSLDLISCSGFPSKISCKLPQRQFGVDLMSKVIRNWREMKNNERKIEFPRFDFNNRLKNFLVSLWTLKTFITINSNQRQLQSCKKNSSSFNYP